MPIGTPEGFLDITNATLRTSVVGISNTGPTGELSVGSNLHVDTTASNVLQVVGNVSSHNMTLGEISLVPAHGLENVTEVGNTTPHTVSFSNATTGLATTSNLHVGGSLKVGVIDFVNPGLTLATVTNNSNVTPYTIDLRNATTGLVTTSNVVVGKDLQVAGNVSLTGSVTSNLHLASNLEVGTANLFVNPATSNVGIGTNLPLAALDVRGGITKTLYNPGEVIEELHSMCNKTSLYGRATTQIVTSFQTLIDSYTDATGSVVTSYTPPVGTKIVLYEYHFQLSWNDDAHSIGHWKLYYQLNGGSWVEVEKARVTLSGQYPENKHGLRWAFEVGATANDSTLGIFTAATPMLGFKWQSRNYNTSNERSRLHSTRYFDGASIQQYSQPMVSITAIA